MKYIFYILKYNPLKPYKVTCLYVLRDDHVTFDRATHWCAPPWRGTTYSQLFIIYLFNRLWSYTGLDFLSFTGGSARLTSYNSTVSCCHPHVLSFKFRIIFYSWFLFCHLHKSVSTLLITSVCFLWNLNIFSIASSIVIKKKWVPEKVTVTYIFEASSWQSLVSLVPCSLRTVCWFIFLITSQVLEMHTFVCTAHLMLICIALLLSCSGFLCIQGS